MQLSCEGKGWPTNHIASSARKAMSGRLTLRWEIYEGPELVTSSIKVYATEKEARADAAEQIARLLRPAPGPDRF